MIISVAAKILAVSSVIVTLLREVGRVSERLCWFEKNSGSATCPFTPSLTAAVSKKSSFPGIQSGQRGDRSGGAPYGRWTSLLADFKLLGSGPLFSSVNANATTAFWKAQRLHGCREKKPFPTASYGHSCAAARRLGPSPHHADCNAHAWWKPRPQHET